MTRSPAWAVISTHDQDEHPVDGTLYTDELAAMEEAARLNIKQGKNRYQVSSGWSVVGWSVVSA